MPVVNGTTYHDDTPQRVIDELERARLGQYRIRVHYGDTETGRDWMDTYHVTGTIGRSTGPNKIPLMMHNARSMGGPNVLDHCIIRIRPANKKHGDYDLYRHPLYHQEATT